MVLELRYVVFELRCMVSELRYVVLELNYAMWLLNLITLYGSGIKLRYVVLELHNVITLKLRYVVQYQRSLTTYLRDRPKKKKITY